MGRMWGGKCVCVCVWWVRRKDKRDGARTQRALFVNSSAQ